jgi:hypothetical protein
MRKSEFSKAASALATISFLLGCGGGGQATTAAADALSPAAGALSSTAGASSPPAGASSPTAGALEVAPYFHSWSGGTLTEAKQASGLNSATLAFAITNGSCALHPDLQNKLPDARNFVAAGGQFIISFGGQNGTYAEIACNDDQLFTLMEKLMNDSGTRRIDWDVEGQPACWRDCRPSTLISTRHLHCRAGCAASTPNQ